MNERFVMGFNDKGWQNAGKKLMEEYMAKTPTEAIKAYVEEKAEEYDVPFDAALTLAREAGYTELFDGFVVMLEDYEMMNGGCDYDE